MYKDERKCKKGEFSNNNTLCYYYYCIFILGMVHGVDPLETVKEEDFDLMFSTNVKGLVLLTQAILPRMKERETGHIINLGSIASTVSIILYEYNLH